MTPELYGRVVWAAEAGALALLGMFALDAVALVVDVVKGKRDE